MAMMNPELAKLLSNGQTAPPSVAGSPVVNALRKMMGAGGSAPEPQIQSAPVGQQAPSQYNPGNQMLQDRSTASQSSAEQSLRDEKPMSTEEELDMARHGIGSREKDKPQKRGREMLNDRMRGKDLEDDSNER